MPSSSRFAVALHVLTLLETEGGRPVTSDYIAASVNTNPVIIRRSLGDLRRAALVEIRHGAGAGWSLARDPEDISLLEQGTEHGGAVRGLEIQRQTALAAIDTEKIRAPRADKRRPRPRIVAVARLLDMGAYEVSLSDTIGVAHPLSVNVETFGTARIADEKIAALINEFFDLRPGAIIRDLGLRKPIYRKTAAYGHFGRTPERGPRGGTLFSWERTDRAAELLRHVGRLSAA